MTTHRHHHCNRCIVTLLAVLLCTHTVSAQHYAANTAVPHTAYTKTTSVKKLTKMAQKGDAVAQFQLGHDYYWGLIDRNGVRDYESARRWLAMAAANGSGEAQLYMGRIYRYGRGVEKDLGAAQNFFRQAQKSGTIEAWFDLGEMMLDDGYPEENEAKGMDYILLAAEGGSALGQENMAQYYLIGEHVKQDFERARYWAEKGMAQNSGYCYFVMGYLYQEGHIETDEPDRKAFELYQKGADLGNTTAQYILAQCYLTGNSAVDEDSLKYLYWLTKSADGGNGNSQYELASHYFNEGETREDSLRAVEYARKSADNEDSQGQNLLGCIYDRGYIVEQDYTKALDCFRKAAAQGLNIAQSNVGLYYALGQGGVKRDVYEAYRYYGESLQNGNSAAAQKIRNLPSDGSDEARKTYKEGVALSDSIDNGEQPENSQTLARLFGLWKSAAEGGNAYAQYRVANCYQNATGVKKNLAEAARWYQLSIDNGNHDGICALANMYHKGEGVDKDKDKAFRLFLMDAMMGDITDQYNTGIYYRYGLNGTTNLKEARRWFEKAAEQGYEKAKTELALLDNETDGTAELASETASTPIRHERRIALVVGNKAYKPTPLRNSLNDAQALKRKLQLLDFDEVRLLSDATKLSLDTCVSRFANDAKDYDVALFFYSGHGVQLNGENYLLPIDIDLKLQEIYASDMSTPLSSILAKLENSGCPVKIAIIDACRDNPFDHDQKRGGEALGGLVDVSHVPDGMYIAFSTLPGKTASDGGPRDENSPFARALLQLMGQRGLELDQVFKRVGGLVRKYTGYEQVPHRQSTLTTDFYFTPAADM